MTEEMISGLVKEIHGSYKVKYQPKDGAEFEIDFSPPWPRIPMLDGLVKALSTHEKPVDAAWLVAPGALARPDAVDMLKKARRPSGEICARWFCASLQEDTASRLTHAKRSSPLGVSVAGAR